MASSSDAENVFAVVGNERRAAILEAAVEHRREHPDDPALSFSELHDRSGIADKGNFNYHLDRLTGSFLKKSDDGYELTATGSKVAGTIRSGEYGDDVERVVTDRECPHPDCEQPVYLRLSAGRTKVRCEDHFIWEISVPPGASDGREPEELLELAAFYWRQVVELHARGTCYECFGHEVGSIERVERDGETRYLYRSRCENCGLQFPVPPEAVLTNHPALVSLYYDHGVEHRGRPLWEDDHLDHRDREVVSEDPLRLRVTLGIGDDEIAFDIDESGSVIEVDDRR